MSTNTELSSAVNTGSETREILGPASNRIRNTEVLQKEMKKKQKPVSTGKTKAETGNIVSKNKNVGTDKLLDSPNLVVSCTNSNGVVKEKILGSSESKVKKKRVTKEAKIVPDEIPGIELSPRPVKRCDWITPNSGQLYIQFHDNEWGVPVRDDKKLFELLILSQSLTELTWPTILYKRETFRMMFEDFDPSSIAKYDEQKLLALVQNGDMSESKLRAVVDNARQFLKIQQDFGSFSNYCWRFMNNKQTKSGYRYARQVPTRTSKSELISKDLTRRGFRYVGPTIVYSFMQVAGLVNDHLLTCYRFSECDGKTDTKSKLTRSNVQLQEEGTTVV